jgi:hypothetical protein
MKTLVYGKAGDIYYGEKELTKKSEITALKDDHRNKGAVGYMTGYKFWNNQRENVIVFFNERPIDITAEENRRRENGLKAAKWNNL